MANVLTPFGFRHIGYLEGFAPTFGIRRRKIALTQTNPIFHGDPIVALASGYIQQAPIVATPTDTSAPTVSGIFQGCEYFSVSQQRKVRSQYWPGSDAQFDPDCFIIDQPEAVFLAACNGTPILLGNVDMNANFFIALGGSASPAPTSGQGNTVNGLSGALIDTTTNVPGTNSSFPFRIVKLYSDDVIQGAPVLGGTGFNGADNTTPFNWAVVTFNMASFKRGVLGI